MLTFFHCLFNELEMVNKTTFLYVNLLNDFKSVGT